MNSFGSSRTRLLAACLLASGVGLFGQTVPSAPSSTTSTPPPTAASTPPPYEINVSGVLDGYANFTNNHPASGLLYGRNFDVRTNTFTLNMARLAISHDADPIGFRVDLGAGRTWDLVNFLDTANGFTALRYVPQAFISVKPKQWKGVQIDFGKFYTSAGAELTESYLNWNYSRSLIFTNGPYYHFGVRASVPVNKALTVGVQVVNGWNNVEDTNSGKTLGLTSTLTVGKVVWSNAYYTGPEKNNTNRGFRNFYDTTVAVNTEKVSGYLNFDYGADKRADEPGSNTWVALTGALKFQITPKFSVSPRGEFYNDRNGFITGTQQNLKEFTFTGEYKFHPTFLSRLEYRRDWSDAAVFERGAFPNSVKNQATVTLGLIFFFENYKAKIGRP